jgi:hypothetical protein
VRDTHIDSLVALFNSGLSGIKKIPGIEEEIPHSDHSRDPERQYLSRYGCYQGEHAPLGSLQDDGHDIESCDDMEPEGLESPASWGPGDEHESKGHQR